MSDLERGKLETYLAGKLGTDRLAITSLWKNLEGWSMQTYSIGVSYQRDGRAVEQKLILRKEPESGLVEPYDASKEYRVITALAQTGVAVPKTYWHEPDPAILGKPFYVMEMVEGVVHQWSLSKTIFDPDFRLIPDDRERESLGRDFVKNIALIHRADWRKLGLSFLGDPGPGQGSAQSQVLYWEDVISRAGFRNHPVVAYATNWLKDNLVSNDRVTVIHGDYRTGNYIARDSRIAAVIDWEMVHLGDPIEDISYIIGGAWKSARPLSWISHLMTQEEFFARYEEESGNKIDEDKVRYYHVFTDYKSIGIGVTAANAFINKANPDLRVGIFGLTRYLTCFNVLKNLSMYQEANANVILSEKRRI
ncbi:MAG: phosphotransferase family protein [Proteobacteria bacterium]|nr:phosphotransferase family protein [Pseudomonadota bacterium]